MSLKISVIPTDSNYETNSNIKSFREVLRNERDNTKEAAERWGITPRQVQLLCAKGRISGAVRFGNTWMISLDAQKPKDGRGEKNRGR